MVRTLCVIVAVLFALPCFVPGCGGDVDRFPVGQARLVDYYHSEECVRPGGSLGLDMGDADVEVEIDGLEVTITHKNAFLNCCLDSILVSFAQEDRLLRLVEHEAVTIPCDCICPFEVMAVIEVSVPGKYMIEVWTEAGLVWTRKVEVGGR